MLVLDVLQFVQSVPSPLRDLARRRTADLGDGTTTSEITWIFPSLALMTLKVSVCVGSGMKQV